jgi:hypothetical protein
MPCGLRFHFPNIVHFFNDFHYFKRSRKRQWLWLDDSLEQSPWIHDSRKRGGRSAVALSQCAPRALKKNQLKKPNPNPKTAVPESRRPIM